nr:ankyrin repeat domain-containing protein [Parachlamydiaceae bacterium]
VCVEGRFFKIIPTCDHPENLSKIQKKITSLYSESNLTPKELMCKILDCNEDSFSEESVKKIDEIKTALLQNQESDEKSKKNDFQEKFVSNTHYKVHSHLLDTLKASESEINRLIGEKRTISYGNPAYDMKSLTDRAIFSIQTFVDQIKLNRLDDQLKEHRVELLQTLYKLHQLAPNVTAQDQEKSSYRLQAMLENAIIIEHVAYVNNLIQAGAEITNYHLYLAIGVNSEKLVDKFLIWGLNPNAISKNLNHSYLELACMRGQKASKAINALIKHGADLTLLSSRGYAPINLAITSDLESNEVFKLIEKMGNLNFQDGKNESLLHQAVMRIRLHNDSTVFNYLLDQGATPNTKNAEGRTPLHSAIELLDEKALPYVKKLILKGGLVTVLDKNDQTPLHYAASQSCQQSSQGLRDSGELVRFLIKNGAQVNMVDNEGRTALHEAVRFGMDAENVNSVEELIKAGVDLDLKDMDGSTALHLAVDMEHVELVRTLLKHGANRNIRNDAGRLPGSMGLLFSEKNSEQILELLASI